VKSELLAWLCILAGGKIGGKVDQRARLGQTKGATVASAIGGQFALDSAHSQVCHQSTLLRPFSALDGTFGKLQWADGTFAHALGKVNGSHDKVSKKSTALFRPFRPFSAIDGTFGKLQWADGAFAHALGEVNGSHDKVSKKAAVLFRPFRPFSALDGALGKLQWADGTFAHTLG